MPTSGKVTVSKNSSSSSHPLDVMAAEPNQTEDDSDAQHGPLYNPPSTLTDPKPFVSKNRNINVATRRCTPIWGELDIPSKCAPVWALRSQSTRYHSSDWGDEPSKPPQATKPKPISIQWSITSKCTPIWGSSETDYLKNTHYEWGKESSTSPPQFPKPCSQDRSETSLHDDFQDSPRPKKQHTKGDKCPSPHDPEAREKHLYFSQLLATKSKPEVSQEAETNIVKQHIDLGHLMNLQRIKLKEDGFKHEASVTLQRLILGCAFVTCSAGLRIQEIICGFESCRIRIKYLPQDVTKTEITTLFSQQGFEPSQYFLRYVKLLQDCKCHEAEVVTTVHIGDLMMAALDRLAFRNQTLHCEKLQAGEMNLYAQNMEFINLVISCKAPSRSVVAVYRSMQETENAMKEKDRTVFHDFKIQVEKNIALKGHYYVPTSVRVFGLPLDANFREVQRHMRSSAIKPLQRVAYDFDEFYEDLTAHLTYSSRVRMRTISLKPAEPHDQGRRQIEVKFDTWQDAKDAMDYLSKKKLRPNYPRLFFHLPPRYRFFSSIPIPQYSAQEGRWKALLEDMKGFNAETELVIRPGDHRVYVHLQGSDCKAVGYLKVKVEKLVKGEKLAENYWHNSFYTSSGREFLDNVSTSTKTLLVSDWRLNATKIYYDSEHNRDTALQRVKEEVERLSSLEWNVKLNMQMVGFFIRKGLQIAKEELGENALSLDLHSRPQKLIVRDTNAGHFTTQKMVDRLLEEARNAIIENTVTSSSSTSTSGTCPVCYDEPTLPIELGCGHSYCLSCFRHYLGSVPDTKTFPLFCMGDEGNCKTAIPIPKLRKFLTPLQFNRLIEVAFFTYIERNPNKIRYCPTPDCPQVYMCSTGENVQNQFQQCPSCLMSVCTSCHDEAHAGITCSEMQLFKDPDEQERRNEAWAQENGVKRCPRCKVWIMKIDGCDHMTCHCGAHICWKCMGVFTVSDIYDHIGTAHAVNIDLF